jgi:uncharacterized membrane protein YfcA
LANSCCWVASPASSRRHRDAVVAGRRRRRVHLGAVHDWCNVPIHNAVATSAALGFPIALAGTVGYVVAGWSLHDMPSGTLGFVYLPALLIISLASVTTAPFGARAAHRMDLGQLKRAFASQLLALAAYMLYKAFG